MFERVGATRARRFDRKSRYLIRCTARARAGQSPCRRRWSSHLFFSQFKDGRGGKRSMWRIWLHGQHEKNRRGDIRPGVKNAARYKAASMTFR